MLAALCGCNSILINTENQTKEEYFDGFPHFFKLALAHGKNDLDRLKTDRKLLKQEHEKYTDKQLKEFIEWLEVLAKIEVELIFDDKDSIPFKKVTFSKFPKDL